MKVLLTGSAGFIGFHVAQRLLARGDRVIGVDNLTPYYDPDLKRARLAQLSGARYTHVHADVGDRNAIERIFAEHEPDRVVHLAAQAGVRYSLTDPHAYFDTNLGGFGNVLEACRQHRVQHLVYASSSSVYGANAKLPFSTRDGVDHPVSLYAASKRANELMAHAYSELFNLPTTGLRFFTVYGPWGRPDMALFLFTKSILAGVPIQLYNEGRHTRSFTYIDDIAEGVERVLDRAAAPDREWSGAAPNPASSRAPFRVYNLGSARRTELLRYVQVLEDTLGRKAAVELRPLQPGDVPDTRADMEDFVREFGALPDTPVEVGVRKFIDWYLGFYKA